VPELRSTAELHSLPCEQCQCLVDAWVDLDQWLDKTVTVRCATHRTTTSEP
jgi:hypothetical protein